MNCACVKKSYSCSPSLVAEGRLMMEKYCQCRYWFLKGAKHVCISEIASLGVELQDCFVNSVIVKKKKPEDLAAVLRFLNSMPRLGGCHGYRGSLWWDVFVLQGTHSHDPTLGRSPAQSQPESCDGDPASNYSGVRWECAMNTCLHHGYLFRNMVEAWE